MQQIPVDSEIEHKLIHFIKATFHGARKRDITRQDSLVDSRIIDSMGVLQLVAFIESEFSITVDADELLLDNFQTVASLTTFVQSKLQHGLKRE